MWWRIFQVLEIVVGRFPVDKSGTWIANMDLANGPLMFDLLNIKNLIS